MTVDREAGTMTATDAHGRTITLDVLAARAMWIMINEAVYEKRSLSPDQTTLTLTCDRGTGRTHAVRSAW